MRRLHSREATAAVALKGPDDPPNRAMIEAHNFTHLPAAPWFAICVPAQGRSDCHTRVKYDSEIPCVQMDFQFISGVAVWCPEAHAKATVMTDGRHGYWVRWSSDGLGKRAPTISW